MSYTVGLLIAIGLPIALALLLRIEDSGQFLAVVIVSELLALWAFTRIKRSERKRSS